jgi:hypothetical protein
MSTAQSSSQEPVEVIVPKPLRGESAPVMSVRLDPDLAELVDEVTPLFPTLKKHAVVLAALRIGLNEIKKNPEAGIDAHAAGILARAKMEAEEARESLRKGTKKK